MKKLLTLMCCLAQACYLFAAKANSIPVVVTQPDGTQLTVILRGDENVNWYTTLDGTLLVQEGDAYYVANVMTDGRLEASRQLAHSSAQRTASERQLINNQDRQAFRRYADNLLGQPGELIMPSASDSLVKRMQIVNNSSLFPHTGNPKALAILVYFTDTPFTITDPQQSFNDYLNNEDGNITNYGHGESNNPKGIRGYFKDMSFGTFAPQFDVVGPVQLPNTASYYGKGNDNVSALMKDACNAIDGQVNFADYDQNNDGRVDLVYIIYAGHSASVSGNSTDLLWPKSGNQNFGKWDGKDVFRYGISNELNGRTSSANKLINGIGLFCHEFSHCMGLPDIYATQGHAGYNQDDFGMEYWDVMDGGEYVRSGRYPAAYSAWEREVMGWMSVDTLTDTTHVEMATIDTKNSDLAKAYKVLNDSVKNEAMYLQNIQNVGWNSYLPGHGLLAYRISYAGDNVNFTDNPNNGSKPRVIVLPADGKVGAMASYSSDSTPDNYYADMAGDTYPGTTGSDSIFGFVALSGDSILKPVINIAETSASLITFDYLGVKKPQVSTGIPSIQHTPAENQPTSVYTIDGRYVGTQTTNLPKGIYIVNRKKVVIR